MKFKRFELDSETHGGETVAWVWDTQTRQVVRDGNGEIAGLGSVEEATIITDIMNQRVERPELTRADGKLVGV